MSPLNDSERKLCEDYLDDTIAISKSWRPPYGMDQSDWESECIDCLIYASRKWEPDGGRSFTSYIYLIIKCRWRDIMKYNSRPRRDIRKKCSLNTVIESTYDEFTTPSFTGQYDDREYVDYLVGRSAILGEDCQNVMRQCAIGEYASAIGKNLGFTKGKVENEFRKFIKYFKPIVEKQIA